jgi:hypothetical protein
MSDSYIILHRAIRNAGDFLIRERTLRLLRWARPSISIVEGVAWRPLRDQFSPAEISRARAIVIGGGPGYARDMYPRVYPLGDFRQLPPVALLALGSHIAPGTNSQVARWTFTKRSIALLQDVERRVGWLGARDVLSERLLKANGLHHVRMVGDPAWYELERIEASIRIPRTPRRVALTPPSNPMFWLQAERLFRMATTQLGVAEASIIFHRGPESHWARVARANGWRQVDISGGANGFRVYEGHDIHIGYRVHAHLYCLSVGVPTYLVAEDSRGRGVHATLGELGAIAFDPGRKLRALHRLAFASATRRGLRHALRLAFPLVAPGWPGSLEPPDLDAAIVSQIHQDAEAGYARHERARDIIRQALPTMGAAINALP